MGERLTTRANICKGKEFIERIYLPLAEEKEILTKLGKYEDNEQEGKLFILPAPIGEVAYLIEDDGLIHNYTITAYNIHAPENLMGIQLEYAIELSVKMAVESGKLFFDLPSAQNALIKKLKQDLAEGVGNNE